MKLLFGVYIFLAIIAMSVTYVVTTERWWSLTVLFLVFSLYWIARCFQTRRVMKSNNPGSTQLKEE